MSAVIKSLRPDPDVDLKNTVGYASICLDCLYKLPQAAAAQRVGTNSDQRRVREHRHTFEQQLETFVSTLKDCYVFADNVGMLRDNLDTASAKEVRSVVEEMAVAGERIHSQVLASIARLHQYSQTSPYDTVWPMTAKNDANEAALDGPMLRTQFRNAIQGLLTSFNHISEFWNDQAVALKTSLNGKDGEFGLTADQAITLADRWARHSPIIMETVHSLVKICDALTVEPELRQGSQRQTSFSTTFTSRTPEQRKYTPRLIGESPNSLPEADQSSQGSRPSAGSEGSRPNKAPTAISGNRKVHKADTCPSLTQAITFTSLVLFACALGPNPPMTRDEVERRMPKYSSHPPSKIKRQPQNKPPTRNPGGISRAKSPSKNRRNFCGWF